MEQFPKLQALLEQERHLQIGGQIYVSLKEQPVLNFVFGESRPGVKMQRETLMLWLSSGKPLTAMAIALLYERGELKLEDGVSRFVPEFAQGGKAAGTIKHLLTHTAGFRAADRLDPLLPWDEMVQKICAVRHEADWEPGKKAGYHTASSWFILGEIIQRISGRSFQEFVRAEVSGPCGMNNTWFAFNSEQTSQLGNKIGIMHNTVKPEPVPLPFENEKGFAHPRPGSTARGPIAELGKFYEMLLRGGGSGSRQILKSETVQLFTTRQRLGLYDSTFRHTLDFGFGFVINSNRYGPQTVPYGYGRFASENSFGHSGAESSCAFADPENKLVAAWVMNGMPGERLHARRARELNSAIYEDLGLSTS